MLAVTLSRWPFPWEWKLTDLPPPPICMKSQDSQSSTAPQRKRRKKHGECGSWTEAHEAAAAGSLDDLRWMLYEEPNLLHERDACGATLLHAAAQNANIEAVAALLEAGCDINAQTAMEKATPLHRACEDGDLEVVRLLVDAGADFLHPTIEGFRPIHEAARFGHDSVVKYLLLSGCPADCLSTK